MKTANVNLVKEINRHIVRRAFLESRFATKHELATMTDLSAMTVGSIIEELVDKKEVYEGNMKPSNGGRPAVEYCYNAGLSHAVLLYGYQKNNQDYLLVRVVNMFGESVYCEGNYLDRVTVSTLDKLLKGAFRAVDNIGIIGCGLPGEEGEDGTVTINDYPDLIGKQLKKHFQEQYNVPVVFENDANAAAYGYYQMVCKHHLSDCTVAGLYFPRLYVPGMGLVINGRIYKGKHNFAGEFTNLPMGVKWEILDYENKGRLYSVLPRLLATICCMVAPETIVLYGDFFLDRDKEMIKERTEELLDGKFSLNLEVSTAFAAHFEYGLRSILLDHLYKSRFGELENLQ